MTDIVDKKTRSRMMAGIRNKDTRPEILVRKALFAAGYRFRLHRRNLPGQPDIVLPGRKIVVFVHGCFWHAHESCRFAKTPSTRRSFWEAKLAANRARDQAAREALVQQGWRVLVVWECLLRSRLAQETLPQDLCAWIEGTAATGEMAEHPTAHR